MIDAVVLAGGESRRMGMPKPLLRHGSTTFLEQIVSVLGRSRVDRTTVVLGARAQMVRNSVDLSRASVVVNPDYHDGQLSSLIAALRQIPADAEAILLCLVDNPFITPRCRCRRILADREADCRTGVSGQTRTPGIVCPLGL